MLSPRPLLLALDDDAALRAMFVRFLGLCVDSTRYDVAAVATPEAVFAALDTHPIPVLVTDYGLAALTGLEVATHVKQRSPATQILLATSIPIDLLPTAPQTFPIDRVLHKPFGLDTFIQWCTAAIRTWEAQGGQARSVGER